MAVSILVLVDFALKHIKENYEFVQSLLRFNPCFGGFCSKTNPSTKYNPSLVVVSILVLVDFALKRNVLLSEKLGRPGFNPCFGGFCSKTTASASASSMSFLFQSLFWWILL